MFENFKNLFNSGNDDGEELFPLDGEETIITPEMFNDDVIRISAEYKSPQNTNYVGS